MTKRSDFHPALLAALEHQLQHRCHALDRGARHVGWKLGMGDRERIGGHIAVGYLTTETVLSPGATYRPESFENLSVDVEAAVQLGRAAEISGYGVALEVVDLSPLEGEPDSVVVNNVFHRAVTIVPLEVPPSPGDEVELIVNGKPAGRGPWPDDLSERIASAVALLDAVGARPTAGDHVITGSIVQAPVAPGATVIASVAGAVELQLSISAD